ncbi:hypothetical protein TNCV_92831 [Trichonephila clavipes]|nr:hypothetical protein TNCV_92831 [Trichonephila clavipes]
MRHECLRFSLPENLSTPGGIEPTTLGLEGGHALPLSHRADINTKFHTVASEQKKQKFRLANIPHSISSSANRQIFFSRKNKGHPASFQEKKCVVSYDVRLASVGNHMPNQWFPTIDNVGNESERNKKRGFATCVSNVVVGLIPICSSETRPDP